MVDPRTPYQVVARRFRPRSFGEVVGQEAVLDSLRSALASGRIPHAFLFAGSRGVGKTTLARILARALNCERGPTPEPCGECAACRSILDGSNPDVVEIDAASNNLVDDMRELRERVAFATMGARFKVYILDEAHMLSKPAFNALLKTLEEPPSHVVFVLATTELHKILETIRSRCQVLQFRRVAEPEIAARLAGICAREQVRVAPDVLAEIARNARGGMRDAETVLERLLPLAQLADGELGLDAYRQVTERVGLERVLELTGALLDGDARVGLRFADEVVAAGADEREALGELLAVLRAVLLVRVDGPETDLLGSLVAQRTQLQLLASRADVDRLDAMIQAVLRGRAALRHSDDRTLLLELTLIRVAQAGQLPALAELAARVAAGAGSAPPGAATAAAAPPAPSPARAPASGAPTAAASAARPTPPTLPAARGDELRARVLERSKQELPTAVSTLELCRLDGPDAQGVVRITLASDKKLHRDRLGSPGVQDELQKLVSAAAGRIVRLQVDTGGGADAAAAAPPARAPRAQPGPAARNVIERFDGRLVDSEES